MALIVGLALAAALVPAGLAQDPARPLKAADRSSPRATLRTFLEGGDAIGAFLTTNYLASPSRAGFHHAVALGETVLQCLDVSAVPAATRVKTGRAAALALYGVLNRIPLPPWDAIPDSAQWGTIAASGTNTVRWVIPDTEIALERVTNGPRAGQFLFSADTVARAGEYFARVANRPFARRVPLENLRETLLTGGGWWIPHRFIESLPWWLRMPVLDQAGWKWIGLGLLLAAFGVLLRVAYVMSRRGSPERPFFQALAQSSLPAFLLLAAPAMGYVALVQINLTGSAANSFELVATAVMFLAGAWISWRLAPVAAEAIIASPRIAPESIDAHLIRITTRLLGILGAAALLAMGADRLGIPVYGIVAGLGVGGLAIALAAQPTIENLIGGLNLFADRPIRVGDLCRCGTLEGTVETIGIRSTRLRGRDRTLTAIPNADLSKMSIVNLSRRDRMLLQTVIGVRYETTPEQLRYLLVRLRELLLGHPRLEPDSVRVRFVAFGASSLDIELVGYVNTTDWLEFLGIREDLWLRVMDAVAQSGTGFAFPSQTVYFARDDGLDAARRGAAEAEVQAWRDQGRLPFPDFTPDQARALRGTVPFPPAGAATRTPPPPADGPGEPA